MTYYANLDWDVRYPPNWFEIRTLTHQLTGHRCCICKTARSVEAHHSRYLWLKDAPGVNIFPLCLKCHRLSHSSKYWRKHKGNPLWRSANTPEWEAKLQQGFKELSR